MSARDDVWLDAFYWVSVLGAGMRVRIFQLNRDEQWAVVVCLMVKLLFAALFTSGYVVELFRPFFSYWLTTFSNPWALFFQSNSIEIFPFPPLLLYIEGLSWAPAFYFQVGNSVLGNVLGCVPTFIADLVLFRFLLYLFPLRFKEVFGFYFCSPIILYSAYVQGQLDLIPTALLAVAVIFLVERKILWATVLYGLALSTKGHTLIALPLMLLYLVHNKVKVKEILLLVSIPFCIYLLFCLPFLFSTSFQEMVLFAPKQFSVFDLVLSTGDTKTYLVVFSLLLVFARFSLYKKVNKDLLFCYLAILYAIFILLISPAPGWYVWLVPFLSIFFIKYTSKEKRMYLLYAMLSVTYLVYFICFDQSPHQTVIFLGNKLSLKITSDFARNLVFTVLEAFLLTAIYSCYKYGVCSNKVYSKPFSPVIGIGGDSGSGKTTLLSDVKQLLSRDQFTVIREIEADGYHKWERGHDSWNEFTHLDPKANYLHDLAGQVNELKSGKTIMRREYLHSTGTFSEPRAMQSGDYIVVCGLHPFYLPKMRKAIDLKIFMDTHESLRTHWKILRDTAYRGYSREQILKQIESRRRDSQKYISPQKSFANIIVRYFSEDEFTPGDDVVLTVKLRLTLNASLQLDGLVSLLRRLGNKLDWDYSDDLVSQYIILHHPVSSDHLQQALKEYVPNAEDLVGYAPEWADEYQGIVQLIILLALSEMIEGSNGSIEI